MTTKILIVDDAAFMRMSIRNLLKEVDCEIVAEAGNGKEALQFYKEHKPDVVLMDIAMPEVDGIEAVKLIKSHDNNASIIMISTNGQKKMVLKAIEAGAKDYIVKPIQGEKIQKSIAKIV